MNRRALPTKLIHLAKLSGVGVIMKPTSDAFKILPLFIKSSPHENVTSPKKNQ